MNVQNVYEHLKNYPPMLMAEQGDFYPLRIILGFGENDL